MSCSHAAGCPLFPLLRASLQGWRDYYCDSVGQWHDCARYQLALTGEPVPISLLPNGARARHLEPVADANGPGANGADANGPGGANPSQAPRQTPPPAPERVPPFEPVPPSAPALHHQPSPRIQTPHPPDRVARHTRRAPRSKRGWWARLADWMRGPA
ncbi:hypothetical protein DIZ27_03435 [Streptomyces sp. NWU339]|nr:hypothetical protein DIZ27_03435 [Streptomyces sp. NWU339]